jgi:hypothetical protein
MTMEKLRARISGFFGGGKKEATKFTEQPGTQQPGGSMGETPGQRPGQQAGGPMGEAQRQGQDVKDRFSGGEGQEAQGGGENLQGKAEGMTGEAQEKGQDVQEKTEDLRDKLP